MRIHRPVTAVLALLAPLALVAPAITPELVQDSPPADIQQELLKRFDTDGDGKLGEEEKAAMRESFRRDREAAAEKKAARETRKEQEPPKDQPLESKGGDASAGETLPEKKPAPTRPTPEEQLARFDTDGDGELGAEEIAVMRDTFRNERAAAAEKKAAKERDVALPAGENTPDEAENPTPPTRDVAAEGERRSALLTRFDVDGDGKLSAEERVAYRAERDRQAAAASEGTVDRSVDPPERTEPTEDVAVTQQSGEELLARFDADGNGELSDTERNTMREAFQQERAELATKRAEEQAERRAARAKREGQLTARPEVPAPPTREEQLARFDTDGDGEIGDDEREAMRETFRAERAEAAEAAEKRAQLKAQRASAAESQAGDASSSTSGGVPPAAAPESTDPEIAANEELPVVYRRYDRDGDGQLSPEESRVARQALIRGGEPETKQPDSLPEGARQFDLDGNGAIDEKERRAAVHTLRERRKAGVGGDGATLGPEVESDVALSRIDRARMAIADELARRDKVTEARRVRLEQLGARKKDNYKKASLAAYSMLSQKGKKSYRPKTGVGDGPAGAPRQGITRGKKRGSEYYRTKMQRGRRGGRRGGQQQYIR